LFHLNKYIYKKKAVFLLLFLCALFQLYIE